MKCASALFLLAIFGGTWRFGRATCVLESDFGFVINCAFKKSGLFRVRNLGGIKAHVGLGFSLGDELGFRDSLTNQDNSRRRSVQASPFIAQAALAQAQKANGNNVQMRLAQQNALPFAGSVPNPPKAKPTLNTPTVPPFKPIPPAAERPNVPLMTTANATRLLRPTKDIPAPAMAGIAVPSFNAMPASISRISQGPTVPVNAKPQLALLMPIPNQKLQASDKMSNNFALRTLPTKQNSDFPPSLPQTNSNSIQSLLAASNITEAALEAAIMQRQQLQKQHTSTPSTTTSTYRPPTKHSTMGKVMNAPKEYYPVGYDKNFDDNFSSRVELPDTSFHCGDQKHFPGLYADEDLGCMVFHVCALTDDGLIMKSFLCPESTLFDQTILKCNWWFYVDCKNSRKLYDSNIPISKSYQLMKALTFFSSYKKDSQSSNNRTVKSTTKD